MVASPRSWLWIALAVSGGCSSARYDAEYAKRIETYRGDAPFAYLQRTAENVAGRLALRLPRDFVAVPKREQRDDGTGGGPAEKPTDPSRLRPPFLAKMPGYLDTFERRLTVDNAEYAASVTIAAVPVDGKQLAAVEAAILGQVRGDDSFKDGDLAWETKELQPIAGGPATWRVLTLRGPQVFEGIVATMPEYKRQPGLCEIWLSADPEQTTTAAIVWRSPDLLAESLTVPIPRYAELVARTVAPVAEQPADEPGAGEPPADGA